MREYGQIIIPLGPACQNKELFKDFSSKRLSKLNGKLIWWSYKSDHTSSWYAVVRKAYFPIAEYKKGHIRTKIRKGINSTEIKKASIDEIKYSGYEVYRKALLRFTEKTSIMSEDAFREMISCYEGFNDIVNFWGVYIDGKLAGYSVLYLYGKEEVNVSELRITPDANKKYASYALFHLLAEEFLNKQDYKYLNNGYRNLVHHTNIQDLLLDNFGYEKEYLTLHLKINFPYDYLILPFVPFRKLIKNPVLRGVLNLKAFST